jgi:hypothetical protein
MPSPAMIVALIALLFAVGGTSYAATKLAANSVGNKQLKKNAVTAEKVKDGSLTASDFKGASLPKGPQGPQGPSGQDGAPGKDGRSALTPLQNGETVSGVIGFDAHASAAGQDFGTAVSFPIPASTGPTSYDINGETPGEKCTGDEFGPTAPPDTVCIYLSDDSVASGNFSTTAPGDRSLGFGVRAIASGAGDLYFQGTWAFTEGPE